MPRPFSHPKPLDLPPEPDPELMPIRHGTKEELAEIHHKYFGPLSPRSLERWPLAWRRVNGRNTSPVVEFLAEAQRRFDAAPVVRAGTQTATPQASS